MEKISYSQIEGYCNELHAVAKKMNEILENVKKSGENILSKDNWNGPAANFFANKMTKLTSNFDDVFKEIENSILFMASCAEGYQAIDQIVVKEICSNLNITEPNLSTSNIFNGG